MTTDELIKHLKEGGKIAKITWFKQKYINLVDPSDIDGHFYDDDGIIKVNIREIWWTINKYPETWEFYQPKIVNWII